MIRLSLFIALTAIVSFAPVTSALAKSTVHRAHRQTRAEARAERANRQRRRALSPDAINSARARVAWACRHDWSSPECRGSVAYCRMHPYDSYCGKNGRTDCSLFPFLEECGGAVSGAYADIYGTPDGRSDADDGSDLGGDATLSSDGICARYPYSPVCRSPFTFCQQNPGHVGCRD